MAKESTTDAASKKVQRAAKTAGQRDKSLVDRMGFASIVGLICVLGLSLVTFAKLTRAAEAQPKQNQDHWHAIYAIWDCTADGGNGAYIDPFESTYDPEGIHSHQDGLIHIHPFFDSSDGGDAQMRVFFAAMDVTEVDGGIRLPDGEELKSGVECDGKPATFEIRKWPFPWEADSADPEVFTSDFSSIQFLNDGEVYQFVLAPEGAEIPPIPEDRFEKLDTAAPEVLSQGPNLDDEGVVEPSVGVADDGTEVDAGTDTDSESDTGSVTSEDDAGTSDAGE